MKMSPAQNRRLNALLTQTGMSGEAEKSALVLYFTANRSKSRKDLEPHQAQALIDHLAAQAGLPGYTPPRQAAPAAQPAPAAAPAAAAPKRRGRPAAPKPTTARPAPDAEAANRMRRKLFAIGRSIGWLSGETDEDRAMNRAKLDAFLVSKSYLKKPLKHYAPAELPKLVSQFEQIQKNVEKAAQNREAGQAVAALLAELDLPTAPARRSRSPRKPAAR